MLKRTENKSRKTRAGLLDNSFAWLKMLLLVQPSDLNLPGFLLLPVAVPVGYNGSIYHIEKPWLVLSVLLTILPFPEARIHEDFHLLFAVFESQDR